MFYPKRNKIRRWEVHPNAQGSLFQEIAYQFLEVHLLEFDFLFGINTALLILHQSLEETFHLYVHRFIFFHPSKRKILFTMALNELPPTYILFFLNSPYLMLLNKVYLYITKKSIVFKQENFKRNLSLLLGYFSIFYKVKLHYVKINCLTYIIIIQC